MPIDRGSKSSVDEIRRRFDADVERFSNIETGQSATMDAVMAMQLVADTAAAVTPHGRDLLDVGCGAGNYTLTLLDRLPKLQVTLVDLSLPMLERARQRTRERGGGKVEVIQADVRELSFDHGRFDIVLAAAVLHHLRTDDEWRRVFQMIFDCLRPGGSFWVFDLIDHSQPAVHAILRHRYGEYLKALKDEAYRDQVFAYIEQEDTPKPLPYQLDLLKRVGFRQIDVLHVNACFAAFGAVKG